MWKVEAGVRTIGFCFCFQMRQDRWKMWKWRILCFKWLVWAFISEPCFKGAVKYLANYKDICVHRVGSSGLLAAWGCGADLWGHYSTKNIVQADIRVSFCNSFLIADFSVCRHIHSGLPYMNLFVEILSSFADLGMNWHTFCFNF